jgi:GABA(A) receptor-associated protein
MSFSNQNNKNNKNKIETLLKKYPDRVPIIITSRSINLKDNNTNNTNFIVPSNITIAEFIIILRKRIKIYKEESIFMFVIDNITKKDIMVQSSITIDTLYSQYKDENLILNLYVEKESVFG